MIYIVAHDYREAAMVARHRGLPSGAWRYACGTLGGMTPVRPRLAAVLAVLALLAGCGTPLPGGQVPAEPPAASPVVVTEASPAPSPTPRPSAPGTTPSAVTVRPTRVAQPPAGATAQCNDGTYSFSQHRAGTCSRHGGVRRWL